MAETTATAAVSEPSTGRGSVLDKLPDPQRKRRTPAADSAEKERISFTIGADGRLDADSLRDSSREKVRRVFSDPALAAKLGLSSVASTDPSDEDKALAGMLYDTLSTVMSSVALAGGYSPESVALLKFDQAEKNHLVPVTARVLKKYATDFKYLDEVMLGAMLIPLMAVKVAALKRPGHVIPFPSAADETVTLGDLSAQRPAAPPRHINPEEL